jgi:hypothetical protein
LASGCDSLKAYHDPAQRRFWVPVGVSVGMLVPANEAVAVIVIMHLHLVVDMSMGVPQISLGVSRDSRRVLRSTLRSSSPIVASNESC